MDGGLEEDEDAIDLVDRIPDMPIRDGHTVADFVVCAYFTSDHSLIFSGKVKINEKVLHY